MGQSNSIPTDPRSTTSQGAGSSQTVPRIRTPAQTQAERSRIQRHSSATQRSSAAFLTRTQISSRNSLERTRDEQTESDEHDQVIYESEERSLRNIGDLRMPEAPINHISAAPLPRPRSVLSRVASNIHHRYSTISVEGGISDGPWNDNEEAEVDQLRSLRRRSSIRSHLTNFTNLRRSSSLIRPGGSESRFSISRPILQPNDSSLNPTFGAADALRRAPTPGLPLDQIAEDEAVITRPVRRSRISRFRQSISGPMDLFRNSFHHAPTQSRSSQRVTGTNVADESDYLIPPIVAQDHSLDMEEHTRRNSEANEIETEAATGDMTERNSPQFRTTDVTAPRQPQVSSTDLPRRSRRMMAGSGRSLPNLLRGRSSRLIRRDDDTPLSRILQLAATAIAAQLSGNTEALASLESVGDDQLDGNLNAFVEELNNAPGAPGSARDANTPPLNFWRVFRFDNPAEGRNGSAPVQTEDPRTVTLVVVGVRSVPSSALSRDNGIMDANLDNLLDLPRLRANSSTSQGTRVTSRLNRHRTFTNNSANLAEVRQNRNIADIVDFGPQPWSTPHSGSPPGPYPPPSTPAERLSLSPLAPHSNLPTTTSSEIPRLSLSSWLRRRSALSSNPSHQDSEMETASSTEDLATTNAATQTTARRRRSDSEAARHPYLRRDDPRRHGFIGPSRERDGTVSGGRSWLIYVIGTNLSQDSPILDMPNLFDLNVSVILSLFWLAGRVTLIFFFKKRAIHMRTCYDFKS